MRIASVWRGPKRRTTAGSSQDFDLLRPTSTCDNDVRRHRGVGATAKYDNETRDAMHKATASAMSLVRHGGSDRGCLVQYAKGIWIQISGVQHGGAGQGDIFPEMPRRMDTNMRGGQYRGIYQVGWHKLSNVK